VAETCTSVLYLKTDAINCGLAYLFVSVAQKLYGLNTKCILAADGL